MAVCKVFGGSQISRWFEGKNVFITGATGFMGKASEVMSKVLVEKLLSSCPGVNSVSILVRPKHGQDHQERLLAIKHNQVFRRLRESHPDRLDKLVALRGDLQEAGLGLPPVDIEALKEMHIVFNMAATVRFNEDLMTSLSMNVLATRSCLELCLKMKNLLAFVHVSTAYANCDRMQIEERVYPPPTDIDKLVKQCEGCSIEELEYLTKRILGKRPNTYTFTKALAENVVDSYKSKLPVAIARPSIVTAAASSPMPGWIDNNSGATGILAAVATGALKVMYCARDTVVDIIPVDYADNALLVAAWATANKLSLTANESGIVPVYNVTSSSQNLLKLSDCIEWSVLYGKRHHFKTFIWSPGTLLISNSLVSLQAVVRISMEIQHHFLSTTFRFSDENFRHLLSHMTEQDKEMFPIDVKKIIWKQYMETYMLGVKKYLLRQTDDGEPKAI